MENSTINYFEYFLSRILTKYPSKTSNDLSVLKVQKLLFFVTAADSGIDKRNILVKEIFKNFVAMPYGHVESTVYAAIKENKLSYYKVTSEETIENANPDFTELENGKMEAIDDAIEELLRINRTIINESPFNLVELSHQYKSWMKNYAKARMMGSNSMPISAEEIINEEKYFHINQLELF